MNVARIVEIMERVDARTIPRVNPCPSREEWEELRACLEVHDDLTDEEGFDWLGRPKDPALEALRRLSVDECDGCRGGMVRYCPIHGLQGSAPR